MWCPGFEIPIRQPPGSVRAGRKRLTTSPPTGRTGSREMAQSEDGRDDEQAEALIVELEEELLENDTMTLPERLRRRREIDSRFPVPEGGLSLGADMETGMAFREATIACVNGLWMSAILTSLTA
jgi:hypothetical protein